MSVLELVRVNERDFAYAHAQRADLRIRSLSLIFHRQYLSSGRRALSRARWAPCTLTHGKCKHASSLFRCQLNDFGARQLHSDTNLHWSTAHPI